MQAIIPAQLNNEERQKIVTFLQKHPVGVLATVDGKGNPHASTIYITTSDDLQISFTTKEDTYKYQNITKHNTVMLTVFEAESQTEVQVAGKAIVAKDAADQQAIYHGTLDAAQKTGDDAVPPIAKIPAGKYVGFVIDIDTIWLSAYGWGDNFATAMAHAHDPEASTEDPA